MHPASSPSSPSSFDKPVECISLAPEQPVTLAQAKAGSADEVCSFLRGPLSTSLQRCALVDHLLTTREAVAHEALCDLYDVAVFKVGDSCFRDSSPEEEHEMWFVSTLAGSGLSGTEATPLGSSREEALALAVRHLRLADHLRGVANGAASPFPASS